VEDAVPHTEFSALDLCPVDPAYAIDNPLFARAEMSLEGGRKFTVVANDVSAVNKYIGSKMLSGRPLERALLRLRAAVP